MYNVASLLLAKIKMYMINDSKNIYFLFMANINV